MTKFKYGYTTGKANIDGTSYDVADFRIVVGRSFTNEDDYYGSIRVDELLLFNEALSPEEIRILSRAISNVKNTRVSFALFCLFFM